MITLIVKILFLFLSLALGLSIGANIYYKNPITDWTMMVWAAVTTGFITLQWLI